MSKQYRKKPVVIEAVQWTFLGDHNSITSNFSEIAEFAGDNAYLLDEETCKNKGLYIKTLEGHMFAENGSWIIKGIKGEFYPCEPEIFDLTYEAV